MSVVICIIGTLSLLIIATGVTSSFDDSRDFVRASDPLLQHLERAQREQRYASARDEALRDRLSSAEARLREINQRLERMTAMASTLEEAAETLERRRDELRRLEGDGVGARQRLDEMLTRRSRAASGTVGLTIAGDTKYKPVFVECREGGCTVLGSGHKIATDRIAKDGYVSNLLENIRSDSQWCLFVLVRRGGIHSFDELYFRARAKVPLGFHPIRSELELDVSDWPQPEWL